MLIFSLLQLLNELIPLKKFYIDCNIQKAMKIANQIADIIIYDHDECQHGVTWETLRFQLVEQEERYRTCTVIKWYYRIRVSY